MKKEKKIWIKLTKHYRNGQHSDYALAGESIKDSKEKQNELMQDWGEHSDGGHSYGYRVEMDFLPEGEIPPKEWFDDEVKRLINRITYLKSGIKESQRLIKTYEKILTK